MKIKILFVCTGNTCRSPMAEAVLKHKSDQFDVQSAGIFAQKGAYASKGTKDVLQNKGISIRHQSQPVTAELIEWADYILTMTSQHKQMLISQYEEAQPKTYTLKEFVNEQQAGIWEQLKKAYTALEEKKLKFISEKRDQLKEEDLQQQLIAYTQDEIQSIRSLEAQLESLDIQDPIGGNFDVYMKTFQEVEKNIELLIKKLDNKEK